MASSLLQPDWKAASKSRREKIAKRIAEHGSKAKNHDMESIRARRARLEELTKAMKKPDEGLKSNYNKRNTSAAGRSARLVPMKQKSSVPNEFDKKKRKDKEKLKKKPQSPDRRSISRPTVEEQKYEDELLDNWQSRRKLGHDERSLGGDSRRGSLVDFEPRHEYDERSVLDEDDINYSGVDDRKYSVVDDRSVLDDDDSSRSSSVRNYSGGDRAQSDEESSHKKEKHHRSDSKKKEKYETDTKEKVSIKSIEEIIKQMKSYSEEERLMGVYRARKHLSMETNPPIDMYIEAGAIPPLVTCLSSYNPNLQFEATWVLTNISSGHTEQAMKVYESGAIPEIIHLLSSPYNRVSDQCVWTIGNLAGDGPFLWQTVVDEGCIKPLYSLIERSPSLSSLRNLSWTFSNILRHKPLILTEADFSLSVKAVRLFLHHPDKETHLNACWSLVYITDNNDSDKIEDVIKAGILPRLIEELLDNSDPGTIIPAIRAIGNVMTGTDDQTDNVVGTGVIPILVKHLSSSAVNIRKDSAWALSNITAGTQDQIQAVIDARAIPPLLAIIKTDEPKVKKEAAWCISNMTEVGTQEQLRLIVRNNLVNALAKTAAFYSDDLPLLVVTFEGLKNILEKFEDRTLVTEQIQEELQLEFVEQYTHHENEYLQHSAQKIVDLMTQGLEDT